MQGILNVYSSKCGWCKNSQHIYPMQRLTYFVKGSITVQLTYCLVLCFAYAELTTDLLVWSDANQSNRRSSKQWHFPLWAKWVWSCLTQLGMIDRGLNVPFKAYFHAWMIVLLKVMLKTTTCDRMTSTSRYSIMLLICKKFYAANPEPVSRFNLHPNRDALAPSDTCGISNVTVFTRFVRPFSSYISVPCGLCVNNNYVRKVRLQMGTLHSKVYRVDHT